MGRQRYVHTIKIIGQMTQRCNSCANCGRITLPVTSPKEDDFDDEDEEEHSFFKPRILIYCDTKTSNGDPELIASANDELTPFPRLLLRYPGLKLLIRASTD